MSQIEETKAKIEESKKRAEDAKKRIAEKAALQKAKAELDEQLHLERFYEAKEKAIETYGADRLVEVDVPVVGMCLFRFAHTADHAAFTREIHKGFELGPCRTYVTKCVIFPEPQTFASVVAEKNPEGFSKCAVAIKIAMRGTEEEQGKD